MKRFLNLYLDKDIYMSFLMVVLIFYPLFDHTNILSLFYSKKQSTIDGKLQFVTRIKKHQSNKIKKNDVIKSNHLYNKSFRTCHIKSIIYTYSVDRVGCHV